MPTKSFTTNIRNHKNLFLITLLFFILGFINIHFALLGILCMLLPLVLLFKNKKKTWCQGYCPRAALYTKAGKSINHGKTTPRFFTKGNMKWIILTYFFISLSMILISTIRVGSGSLPPMERLKFLIFFPIPGTMPQFFELGGIIPWATHLAYRFYSMMMTTTTLGLILALIYKPRTWCTICPINTISDVYIKTSAKGKEH